MCSVGLAAQSQCEQTLVLHAHYIIVQWNLAIPSLRIVVTSL